MFLTTPSWAPPRRPFRIATFNPRGIRFVSAEPKQVSPHVGFYKTFGRPVAKVFLMATFAYQLAYWSWVKLEKDEARAQKQAELSSLETELHDMTTSKGRP